MAKSGGITARNFREGFRSEYVAHYIFSAFGTSVIVTQGNDIGIDLLCSLTEIDGHYITFKSTYGVQVKSEGSEFKYSGKQATKWLSDLEYPLLFALVSKETATVKIYSAWNLNWYLLGLHTDDVEQYPDEITFVTSENDVDLEYPSSDGRIPIGRPILDINLSDLGDDKKRSNYWYILSEWLSFDNYNVLLRRAGAPYLFGYRSWATNKSLKESQRGYNKQYFYSPYHSKNIKKLLAKSFTSYGLYLKENFAGNPQPTFRTEFNLIRSFTLEYLNDFIDDFERSVFANEI